jgi:hypothetical protein
MGYNHYVGRLGMKMPETAALLARSWPEWQVREAHKLQAAVVPVMQQQIPSTAMYHTRRPCNTLVLKGVLSARHCGYAVCNLHGMRHSSLQGASLQQHNGFGLGAHIVC